eukprot:scaffold4056_cov86-Skeletonema_dohrnii-CCMP3373.AAC.1
MKQLYYAALLTGLLLVSLVQANEEAELLPTENSIHAASLLSTGGSRHRLSTHKKSHRRKLSMNSLRNGLLDGSDDVELDDKFDDLGVDEDEVDDERLLQKKKTNGNNSNKKKKNGNNNKKKKKSGNNNNNKNNNKKNGNDNKKKKSGNKKEKLIKQKIRNQKKEKKKEKQKDKKQELCLCEDLYGPDYWSTSWNDYDDDWDSTLKRKQHKNSRNKKRNNGRLLLAAAEDEQE